MRGLNNVLGMGDFTSCAVGKEKILDRLVLPSWLPSGGFLD
jgi:hypothetical protein